VFDNAVALRQINTTGN
jgi:hypothetical protein